MNLIVQKSMFTIWPEAGTRTQLDTGTTEVLIINMKIGHHDLFYFNILTYFSFLNVYMHLLLNTFVIILQWNVKLFYVIQGLLTV